MKRRGEQLVEAATRVIHERGAAATTLAIVASAADVPLGNVYYYFKTKDDLVNAVVEARLTQLRALFAFAEQNDSPVDRLCAVVDAFRASAETIVELGCAYGSLASELEKEPRSRAAGAGALFSAQLEWMEAQFRALRVRSARARAAELLCAIQGACLVAHALHDPSLFVTRLGDLSRALRAELGPAPGSHRKARSS